MHILGIHGDPMEAKRRIEKATREGRRLGADAYGYKRAFSYSPSDEEKQSSGAATSCLLVSR